MAQLDPYLIFNGNCAEAMHFYARTLGGKIEQELTFRGSPGCEGMAAEVADQIMHIRMTLGDRVVMASDSGGQPFHGRHGFSLTLTCDTADDAARTFNALAEGGKVTMPLGPTFWAESFGMLEDRFGTGWMVNAGLKAL